MPTTVKNDTGAMCRLPEVELVLTQAMARGSTAADEKLWLPRSGPDQRGG